MRDQRSQFVPNSSIDVVGERKICFQTIILKGVNFIVNSYEDSFQWLVQKKYPYKVNLGDYYEYPIKSMENPFTSLTQESL